MTAIDRLLINRSNNPLVQLFRYFWVGGICFVVDMGLMILLTEYLRLYYLLSACLSFCAGLTLNYFLSIKWVFNRDTRTASAALRDFIGFAAVGIIGLALNALIMWISTDLLSIHYVISKILSTIIVFVWNFVARRFITSPTETTATDPHSIQSLCQKK